MYRMWQIKMGERWGKCNEATCYVIESWVRTEKVRISSDMIVVWK